MRPPRLSTTGFLGIIAVIALGMAALRYASNAWAVAFAIITLAVLFTSILGAIYGTDRAFWRGVALFGWGFLLVDSFTVWWIDPSIRPSSSLTSFLTQVYPVVRQEPPREPEIRLIDSSIVRFGNGSPTGPRPVALWTPEYHAFVSIGVWLSRLFFAFVGGIVGQIMIARSRPPEA
jgi:hypothetical protein